MEIIYRRYLSMIMVFCLVLIFDQYLKIRAVLAYRYLLNDKAVFGLLGTNSLALVVGVIFVLAIIYLIFFRKLIQLPLAVLLAAVLSNLIDRLIYKGVVDYWNFFGWFRFNFSDLLIVAVVVYYLVAFVKTKNSS